MTALVTETGRYTSEVSTLIAGEIRAEMARQGVSQRALAQRIGMNQSRLSDRIGKTATVELAITDVIAVVAALGADLLKILEPLNQKVLAGEYGENYLKQLIDSKPRG